MKINITMKSPDSVHDAREEALADYRYELENSELENGGQLDSDEIEEKLYEKKEELEALFDKWFEYGEYLRVEIDTETKTIKVLDA